jgi:Icc-related predicted phosphoesterase
MTSCWFVSDLHGHRERYRKLFEAISQDPPTAVFLGGDLFPSLLPHLKDADSFYDDFAQEILVGGFRQIQRGSPSAYPRVFLILGNDDARIAEDAILQAANEGIWEYIHNRKAQLGPYTIFGYACVPPTPFRLKDWERYDVSRYLEPGCLGPEEGWHTVPYNERELTRLTIRNDLEQLTGNNDLSDAVILFHAPPYGTRLDRAALDGKMVDYAPLDVHVGSVAVRRFIEARQPLVTLHGHIHESARLAGSWKEHLGRTCAFSAAHDGPELAIVRFELERPEAAMRELR